ncbi:MAG: 3-isopropylmalate dehydratase [Ignavibacteria bacterium RIFOXYB2_FULL_35_12]|nr:MAG: 3-isopropylmalate dehydratase [Ignavibacteria bacterium GWA2_36_19]OGU59570.1 MAG: 3-isopropylmalate dehydratase [Ignavibacteria bacterium GWF2_35_20]OGU78079.1 MAG: 3-isopropylmalate dehydratase [Ignavibacteria bacterium RIFOXYA2_FULL_35_9]OGU87219.1 MAG: 3-isopropylmalate dehydratase [Ignavibacteria bacterium RIFOXYA12_FULL_35_25]OGU90380.1 MAG: 3-isopropylmalate dehydratase [Ignavibacteria bacterium RIFOXYC12_FULL_35_11]OGU97669.1 MAG: 3-isopropylmalate dehydratase [Ignavibacteria b
MEKKIIGKAYVLGDNIDTDQIIPAEHLVYSTSDPEELKKYGHFALSSVPIEQAGLPFGGKPFIDGDNHKSKFNIIVGGSNFGCGSSREHAPLSLQVAGVKAVVAESYARIFYRNSVDGGFVIPFESSSKLNDKIKTGDDVEVDLESSKITNHSSGETYRLRPLGSVYDIVKSGGLFNYARENNMI